MIIYIEEMLRLILGDYFFTQYTWSTDLLHLLIFVFALLIIYLTYKFWTFILFRWWKD